MKTTAFLVFLSGWIGLLTFENDGTNWTMWGEWTTCDVTCGGGFKIRTRNCQKSDEGDDSDEQRHCHGPKVEKRACNKVQCRKPLLSTASYWGEWSEWGMCSLKGSIIELRTRTCYVAIADQVNPSCLGDSFEMTASKWPECSLLGSWSSWSGWSDPAVTCSNSQLINLTRSRSCLGNAVKGLSLVCSGESNETKGIKMPMCNQWTEWGDWITYKSSDKNLCIRERECLPTPGLCPGPYKEGTRCQLPLTKNKQEEYYDEAQPSEMYVDESRENCVDCPTKET